MLNPIHIDLLFTVAACASLLGFFVATLALVPWGPQELRHTEAELRDAARALVPTAMPLRARRAA